MCNKKPRPTDDELRRHAPRFWAKVKRLSAADCWPWLASTDKDGYGRFSVSSAMYGAHRLAYWLSRGSWPPIVRHACDTPECCNPAHLLGGTQRDNVRDRQARDRQAKGSANGRAKLGEDEVRQIKAALAAGEKQAALARRFSISPSVIRDIKRGTTWRHVA